MRRALLTLACALCLGLLGGASPAFADQEICAEGAGPGQCSAPSGVAVNRTADLLYVADAGNKEVDVFDADSGSFVDSFDVPFPAGVPPAYSLTGIAVDNDPASTAHGDIYVLTATTNIVNPAPAELAKNRVLRFHRDGEFVLAIGEGQLALQPRLGVGPEGVVHVADAPSTGSRRLQKFDHEGNEILECPSLEPAGDFRFVFPGIAIRSGGDFFIASPAARPIRRYDASCSRLSAAPFDEEFHASFNVQTLASDASDNLYVSDITEAETATYLYTASGALAKVLYGEGTWNEHPNSLAPYGGPEGDIFVSEAQGSQRVLRVPSPPPGPVVAPHLTFAEEPVPNTWAELATHVNPEGQASTTSYRFQYVDEQSYEEGEFAGAAETPEEALPAPENVPGFLEATPLFALARGDAQVGCPDPTPQLVEEGKCLAPRTKYRARAVAKNDDGEHFGTVSSFTTGPPFELLATWATKVGADSARVHAEANPLGIALSGHFEYVEEASFEESGFAKAAKTAEVDYGSGEGGVTRGAQLHGLKPGTSYRYRAVLENFFESEAGPAQALRSFAPAGPPPACAANAALRVGPSANLPDCRAYEMVSPVDKAGGEIIVGPSPISELPAELNKSAAAVPAEGRGFTYSSQRAFGDAVSAPFTSQYLASRVPGEGWRSHGISPPLEGAAFGGESWIDTQYKAFSEDLRFGWLRTNSEPSLDGKAIAGFPNLYRRDNAGEAYASLCMVAPPVASPVAFTPEPQGFSADGALTFFRANDKLSGDASSAKDQLGQPITQVYGCGGGAPRLVSVLPPALGGEANRTHSSVGTAHNARGDHRRISVDNAVAADGQRVYWTAALGSDAAPAGGTSAPGRLYLRENALQPPSDLDHGFAAGAGDLTEGSETVSSLIAAAGKGAIEAGSPTVSGLETTTGAFVDGQPITGFGIPAGTTIVSCEPKCGPEAESLTLDKNATFSVPGGVPLSSKGPVPFAAGQLLSAPGIPEGTRIEATSEGSLILSAPATQTVAEAPLRAHGECIQPERACTVEVSEAVGLPGSEGEAEFWMAAADGSRAIFSFVGGPLIGRLYEFDAASKTTEPIAEGVSGVAGASADTSRVYFVSTKALAEGAVAGKANLYLYESGEGGDFELVAPLPGFGRHAGNCFIDSTFQRCARATPDGQQLLFMSRDPLTGYDNRDARSGEASAEVFLYDAGEEELLCVSCNPSGARPAGSGGTTPIAAQIPGRESGLQASRVLSEDGRRLFFESYDALVLEDTNGALDVYEWQEAGKGDCDAGDHHHFEANGGCLALISSGRSPQPSEFLDASADGTDVFFKTSESLWPEDPGLIDVYDARAGGGFPPPPAPKPACEGEACQSPPAPPRPPTPASSAYTGPGELPASPPSCARPARKARALSRLAKRSARAARRSSSPRRTRRMRRVAKRRAMRARRLSRAAKRCRARQRASRRAAR